MIRFINYRNDAGEVETIDEVDSKMFVNDGAFFNYVRKMVNEYKAAYFSDQIYSSQRPTKNWKNQENS